MQKLWQHNPETEMKIDRYLSRMTETEKIGQLNQLGPSEAGAFAVDEQGNIQSDSSAAMNYHEDLIRAGNIGSLMGIGDAQTANRIQRIAVEQSRLGIPLLFGLDVIHGFKTIFPIPLAESCSWEPALAKRSAAIAACEASSAGINWTFAPMVDVARDARWGRIAEGAGEDPFLASQFAAARVEGFQGDDLSDPDHLAACAKHFIAYGAAESGRDYNTADISEQSLYETYLPPFRAAVRSGVATFMSAFQDLNGVPCSANRKLLTELLRNELGFSGFVVSDCNAVKELIVHGFVESRADAGCKALTAGIDMDMVSGVFSQTLPALISRGLLDPSDLDEAVRRVLRVKFALGLFDNPYRTTPEKQEKTLMRPDFIEAARHIARRSMVLLKNSNDTLPLKKDISIAVVGPLADDAENMLGSWAFSGGENTVSVLEGLRANMSPGARIFYAPGCSVSDETLPDFFAALQAAERADAIVAVVGERNEMSGEAASRTRLGLPGSQEQLLAALRRVGKPLIVVLINGRPLSIPWIAENADAVLEAWQPGTQAGNAVADVLYGDYNPSGKLTVSFPYTAGQEPLYYNRPRTGRPETPLRYTSKYLDCPTGALYPFGFGLSYTTFAYRDLEVSASPVENGGVIRLSATVENAGTVFGEETVQLYLCDRFASRVRPVRELRGFCKLGLRPGQSRRVDFTLTRDDLRFYDAQMRLIAEPGEFSVWIGPDSIRGLEGRFTLLG